MRLSLRVAAQHDRSRKPVSRVGSSSCKGERETARCSVAALADIRDIRFGPLRAAHPLSLRSRRRLVHDRSILQRTSDSGH